LPENTTGVEEVLERAVDKALEQAEKEKEERDAPEANSTRHKHRVSNSANRHHPVPLSTLGL